MTNHPTWMQFVQGKRVESAVEQGEWHVIQFTDGTTFHFTSNDKFVLVEAPTQ